MVNKPLVSDGPLENWLVNSVAAEAYETCTFHG